MKKLLLIALLIVGCDNSTEANSDTYSVSDLEGVWMGALTYDDDQTLPVVLSFDSQGNLFDWIVTPETLSLNSNLDVSDAGDITGIITAIHINTYNIEQTSVLNLQGSKFVSKDTIEVNLQFDWSNTSGYSGSYSMTGTLIKQSYDYDSPPNHTTYSITYCWV